MGLRVVQQTPSKQAARWGGGEGSLTFAWEAHHAPGGCKGWQRPPPLCAVVAQTAANSTECGLPGLACLAVERVNPPMCPVAPRCSFRLRLGMAAHALQCTHAAHAQMPEIPEGEANLPVKVTAHSR